jgi:mRNA interferase MazF
MKATKPFVVCPESKRSPVRGVVDKYDECKTTNNNSAGRSVWPSGFTYEEDTFMKENEKEIKRGEIYYCRLDPVQGSEQGGTRPGLCIQNDTGNKYSPTIIIAPITGQIKKQLPTHVPLQLVELPQDSIILLEQIRTIDKSRIGSYVGKVSEAQMQKVEQAIDVSLGMSYLEGLRHE